MQADVIQLNGTVRASTLKRLENLLYGSFRSCNPTNTLGYASRAIGRELRHVDVIHGRLTEREALHIIRTVGPLFPDLREKVVERMCSYHTP